MVQFERTTLNCSMKKVLTASPQGTGNNILKAGKKRLVLTKVILAVSTFFMLQFTFSAALNGTIRTYYVGAVEEDWDYMPRRSTFELYH
jgi:hypothetical protein